MEGVAILLIMAAAFVLSAFAEKKPPPPPKTTEQELGKAIAKYLAHGVNIRLSVGEKKE
ncbi:hypothetical protein [Leptolyngbya sp. FACHB-16]|uniref:hypothetical protein n=1 Tax=unclassified Leptolyngbya TaxID=2650499 RepID=UPI0016882512|nr:hypothetical protein [Leptolyngbya sp. FACHB-16]MBD2153170.1 hypothetical protein [Leptolyngbya sp. FACHB-16]